MKPRALFVVVRDDLPPGLQLAQACHAARDFSLRHPGADVGENLIALAATHPDLQDLVLRVAAGGLCLCVPVHEPDLGGQLTAAAFGSEARPLLSCLPLALRGLESAP